MLRFRHAGLTALALSMALSFGPAVIAKEGEYTASVGKAQSSGETYSSEEIVEKGHNFFGKTTRGVAEAIEYVFSSKGEPTAYIVGEEAAGAVVAGLRYGEGTIYYKNGMKERIFWQGPSVGFDFGGNGSRALVLVYNSTTPSELHDVRFGGVEGSAYLVGGLGVNYEAAGDIVLAPIRTGVGARLGANIGYLKYTPRPTWNPF
jgi:hypothetical protein